ncbi:MAG: hypothetical protein EG823_01460 [Actinobacteria bacterium]|nr:hypothetical protein [Actinomycetota bacterium]
MSAKKRGPSPSHRESASTALAGTPSRLAVFVIVAGIGALFVPAVAEKTLRMDLVALWTGVAGAGAAVALLATRSSRRPRLGGSLAWVLFLVWTLLASVLSGRVWAALSGDPTNRLGWMTLAALTAIALASAAARTSVVPLLRRYAWVVVSTESVYALIHLAVTGDTVRGGTLPNSSDLGIAIALLLPWVVPPAHEATRPERLVRFASAGLALFALGAIRSRAALVVVGLWAVLAMATRWRAPARSKAAALAVLVLVAIGGLSVLPGHFLEADSALPLGGRVAMWTQGLVAAAQRPLTGWGPDAYWPASAAVRTPEMAAAGHSVLLGPNAADPHNFLVWILVSTGVVGLMLWFWYITSAVRAWWVDRSDHDARAAGASVVCALVLGLYAPLDLHVLPVLAVMVGLCARPGGDRALLSRLPQGWREQAAAAGLAVVALASAVYALNAVCRAPYDIIGEDRSPALASGAARMSALWPFDARMAYLSALHAGWAATDDPGAGWQDADMQGLTRAVRVDRRDPFYALERARAVKYFMGTPAEVDSAFAEAFKRYPAYPIARAEYAQYLAETGRYDEARVQLDLISAIDDPEPTRENAVEAAEAILEEAGK